MKFSEYKKNILLDADDVLYNTMGAFLLQYNSFTKEKISLDDLVIYNLYDIVKQPFYVDIILKNPSFFENLPLKNENTVEIVRQLNEKYNLFIVTAAYLPAVSGKIKAFERDFPFLDIEQYIFTWSKWMIKGDIMIDDSINNLTNYKKYNPNCSTICYNMKHNLNTKEFVPDYRIDNIDELELLLLLHK